MDKYLEAKPWDYYSADRLSRLAGVVETVLDKSIIKPNDLPAATVPGLPEPQGFRPNAGTAPQDMRTVLEILLKPFLINVNGFVEVIKEFTKFAIIVNMVLKRTASGTCIFISREMPCPWAVGVERPNREFSEAFVNLIKEYLEEAKKYADPEPDKVS